MQLLVIGHTVEDHVYLNGEDVIKPGGIFYTVLGLKNIKDNEDSIWLNTFVQHENYHLFASAYEGVEKKYIEQAEKIPKVYLTLHDFKERGETYESISQNLNINIEDINSYDGILINMITGFDINLNQLKNIKREFTSPIFMDVHTLSRGLDENLKRRFRPIPEVEEWLSCVDILQANESELKTLSSKENEIEAAEEIFKYGVRILIITKDKIGARVYAHNNNEIISIFKSSIKIGSNNTIGCGDIFGAVFFYTYIKTGDWYRSLALANTAAGFTASYEHINAFNGLKKDVFSRYN